MCAVMIFGRVCASLSRRATRRMLMRWADLAGQQIRIRNQQVDQLAHVAADDSILLGGLAPLFGQDIQIGGMFFQPALDGGAVAEHLVRDAQVGGRFDQQFLGSEDHAAQS